MLKSDLPILGDEAFCRERWGCENMVLMIQLVSLIFMRISGLACALRICVSFCSRACKDLITAGGLVMIEEKVGATTVWRGIVEKVGQIKAALPIIDWRTCIQCSILR